MAEIKRCIGDRFEIERWLGEGGMGTVYLAHDKVLGRRVAIKVLLEAEPDALDRFKREFRTLAHVSHPNLIVLHELLHLEGLWLFTMDYVPGQNFLSAVSALEGRNAPTLLEVEAHRLRAADSSRATYGRPITPVRSEPLLRHVLGQLTSAIRALHAAHKLHLDLKPSNVLVSAQGEVTVLDFGLARDLSSGSSSVRNQRVIGTPAYMSPEQAQGQPLAAPSDWYSVGVMLFEALTGRLPFEGSIPEIMLGKCEREPLRPSELSRGIAPDLDDLCVKLLARNAEDRPDGDGIAKVLGVVPIPVVTRAVQGSSSDLFIGRDDAIKALSDSPPLTLHVGPRMLLVHGASGVGKTTLARRFLRNLEERGNTLILQGACYERESVPFKAWDGLVDALVAHLLTLDAGARGTLMPRHRQVLPRLFPAFGKLIQSEPMPEGEDLALDRARAFRAFAELIARLSDQTRLVLFIDDLHWGDLDSALLMRELFEGKDPPQLMVLGTYRPEESEDSAFFRELATLERSAKVDIARLSIAALSEDAARSLSLQLLEQAGIESPELASHIARESRGVPLFIHELVRHADASADEPRSSTPISLLEALGRRIARLPSPAVALLEVLSVAGRPITQEAAYRAANLPSEDLATLHALRAAGFAKSRGSGPSKLAEPYHDRIREVVVAGMPRTRLVQVHSRLLAQFEERGEQDLEQLVAHALGAERHDRALSYAERAADRARAVLAFNRSVDLYRTALSCLDQTNPSAREQRGSLEQKFGEALAAAGYCLESAHAYLRAASLAEPPAAHRLERSAADQLLRGGDLSAGITLLSRVLSRHDIRYPSGTRAALAALTVERARLAARGLSFDEKPASAVAPSEREALEALRPALGVYWLVEPVRGALFATQYLRRALDAGDARSILRGLETEGAYIALMGGAKAEQQAGEVYALCSALAKRTGNPNTMSGYKLAEAGFHAIYGRKKLSSECATLALSQPNQPGLSWERAYARFHLYQSCLYIGGRPGLAHEIERLIDDAESRRDGFAVATLLPMLSLAQLMADKPALALEATARMRPKLSPDVFSFLDMQEMLWTSIAYTYQGRYGDALDHYAARHGRYAGSGMPRLQVWRVLSIWGQLLAHMGALTEEPHKRQHRLAILEHAKQIENEELAWPMCFASEARALLAHHAGDCETRDRLLEQAIGQAEQLGYHPFVSLFRRCAARQRGNEQAAQGEAERLRQLGIASADGWQRAWAPGLTPQ